MNTASHIANLPTMKPEFRKSAILKWILKGLGTRMWIGFSWSRIRTSGGL